MRVLLLTDWPAESGGAETYLTQLRRGLEATGIDTRLLTSSLGSGSGADDVAAAPRGRLMQGLTQLVNPAAVRAVRASVRAFRPDVVHVSGFELGLSPAIFAALAGTPAVVNVTWPKPVCPTGHKLLPDGTLCVRHWGRACRESGCVGGVRLVRERARYGLIAHALRSSAAIVTCSSHMASMMADHGYPCRVVNLPALPPGPGFARRRAAEPLFVAVGRLSREKGLDVLVRAVARLRRMGLPARVRLVGDGPDRAEIVALAAREGMGHAVQITGWLEHGAIDATLEDAWALVAPSLWAEPLGLSAVEAIVRRIPVVASAVGGYAETVEEGTTGLLFPNGDVDALAGCLEALCRGSVFADGVVSAEAAARLARRHDLAGHVEEMTAIFAEVVR